jgi:urea transport system substrate-binding protein
VGEQELSGINTGPLLGHLAAWNYFQSIDTPANEQFIENWHAYTGDDNRVTNDPMEATYIGFNLWTKAVEKAGTTDVDTVIDTLPGLKVDNLTGGTAELLPNHHITKPVYIGEITDDGQFSVVWETDDEVPGDAWSDFLPDSKKLKADWVDLDCGHYNTETESCTGQSAEQ